MFKLDLAVDHKQKLIHFIGIGGIGMSSVAELFHELGWIVSGSDISKENRNIINLKKKGVTIFQGHKEENIKSNQLIVYSSAIKDINPEMKEAKKLDLPIYKRATVLSKLMSQKKGIAVAGTHGKTTTTSMLATIFEESGENPSYSVGGIVSNLSGHAKIGDGEYFLAEVDESDGSFLEFRPELATITNIDNDHLDYYKTEENLFNSFLEFTENMPSSGCVSINIHDELLLQLKDLSTKKILTVGFDSKADYVAQNIKFDKFSSSYDLFYQGKFASKVKISLHGQHNIMNSLGAISMAHHSGLDFQKISEGIKNFTGVGRRQELLFSNDMFDLIDDYAHHPTEIESTLKSLKEVNPDKLLISIFQPHRFTRTQGCWESYTECFNNCDKLYLTPIFAASEERIEGITSVKLSENINHHANNSFSSALKSLEDIELIFEKYKDKNVVLVVMGAGTISSYARKWVDRY